MKTFSRTFSLYIFPTFEVSWEELSVPNPIALQTWHPVRYLRGRRRLPLAAAPHFARHRRRPRHLVAEQGSWTSCAIHRYVAWCEYRCLQIFVLGFFFNIFIYVYKSSVRVFVIELLLNSWSDSDQIFCVYSRGLENGLDSQSIKFCADKIAGTSYLNIRYDRQANGPPDGRLPMRCQSWRNFFTPRLKRPIS